MEEVVLESPAPGPRGPRGAGGLDVTCDVGPAHTAVLALRRPSGALTFHLPAGRTGRAARGSARERFHVPLRPAATRGIAGRIVKAIVIRIAHRAADEAAGYLLPRLAAALEAAVWRKRGLEEGWVRVTRDSLAAGVLERGGPESAGRSLLLLHGPFSDAASTFGPLAGSGFFDGVAELYGDRIFAFNHFTVSRTPAENARMLLEALPAHGTTFDVVAHSRGGLVLRTIVENAGALGALSRRFSPGRAVLVAVPNEGTPLATPARWDETIGWIANLLEMLPDNPFTSGAAFVANGLVWLANHASGDLPGLHAMDGDGEFIAQIQAAADPPVGAYSALVANYRPETMLERLLDLGIDRFFGGANDLVVPSEGGWRTGASPAAFIPASRIGCFGPGGNLPSDAVTHVSFFSQPATTDFLLNALSGRSQALGVVNPSRALPDPTRSARGATTDGVARAASEEGTVGPRRASHRRKAPEDERLRIAVTNGDLTFEPEALLLGHYHALRLTGTEAAMDRAIGGAMAQSLRLGAYPLTVNSNQIFVNTRVNVERGTFVPRPRAVIVVGLGEEGKLRGPDLAHSVRQAVIAWAQRLAETDGTVSGAFKLATTLMGSGGSNVSAGEAARLIAQGVYDANAQLKQMRDGRWPRVSDLHVVELYLDRATEAWRALRLQEVATPGHYRVEDAVREGVGALERPADSGYRGADYDFITVEGRREQNGEPSIAFTLDTRRARSEVHGQRTQTALLRDLVATASSDQNCDPHIGGTLFNLLIPVELEPYLAGSGELQMELDPDTAGIPWELLDTRITGEPGEEPWALRVKLLRKLRIERFREAVTDADADDSVLVIGEPECPAEYPRLYGARSEALAVCARLTAPGALKRDAVASLISDDPSEAGASARTVVNALFERTWRIVHIAGHGVPPGDGRPGGVVLSNGTFLGPAEIDKMRTVPELVFINCCYLAAGDPNQLLRYDRASFASSVAGALVAIGVRCVIAAGWAVDDDAANAFAGAFYESLLRGSRFIDAVGHARRAAYELRPDVNTWAAYQCYGDPDWTFLRHVADPNRASAAVAADFSGIASETSLLLELQRRVVGSKFQSRDPAAQLPELRQMETLFGDRWGSSGKVAERFGEAFVEAGAVEAGIHWYARAVAAPDGTASMRAAEQLANTRSRLAWELVDAARQGLDETAGHAGRRAAGRRTGQTPEGARRQDAGAERSMRRAVARADDLVAQALALLEALRRVEDTMERASLVGAVYKRKALVDAAAGRRSRVLADLRLMKACYQRARAIGTKSGERNLYYPAANCLAADVALNAGTRRWAGLDPGLAAIAGQSLEARNRSDADFWSVVGDIELRQYEALAARKLAASRTTLETDYLDLYTRLPAIRMWASVYDNACLILSNYAERVRGRERAAAAGLLASLRAFAHPRVEGKHAD